MYYICFTKSYFSSSDQFTFKKDSDFFRIEAFLENEEASQVVIKAPVNGKKTIEVNNVPVSKRTDYLGKFNAVMIAPNDNLIILGGSELRRKFMSGSIGQYNSGYLQVLFQYQKILKQRNAALKQFQKRGRVDEVLLETLNEQLIESGSLVFSHRKEFIKAFLPLFNEKYRLVSDHSEKVAIEYMSSLDRDKLEQLLSMSKEKDLITCRTNQGPHKDDLVFKLNNQPLKSIGSQGQQKSFLMAFKLAQYDLIAYKTKKYPFYF